MLYVQGVHVRRGHRHIHYGVCCPVPRGYVYYSRVAVVSTPVILPYAGPSGCGYSTQPSTPAAGANATANATEVLQAPPGTPAVLVPNPADMMSPAPPTPAARAAQRDEVAICATAHGKCYAISRGLAHHPKASPMSPGLRLFSGRGSTAAPWRASKERRLVWLRPSFASPPH